MVQIMTNIMLVTSRGFHPWFAEVTFLSSINLPKLLEMVFVVNNRVPWCSDPQLDRVGQTSEQIESDRDPRAEPHVWLEHDAARWSKAQVRGFRHGNLLEPGTVQLPANGLAIPLFCDLWILGNLNHDVFGSKTFKTRQRHGNDGMITYISRL